MSNTTFRRFRSVGAAFAAVAVWMACANADVAAVRQQPVTDWSGVFTVLWMDPEAGSGIQPVRQLFLTDDESATYALDVGERILQQFGGPEGLHRHRVRLTGVYTSGAAQGALPVIRVTGLALLDLPRASAAASDVESVPASSGNQQWLTILCKYADVPAQPANFDYFQMYANTRPFLDYYWREQSYGALTLVGSATVGWVTLPLPLASYMNGGIINTTLASQSCAALVDASVNFPDYEGINFIFNGALSPPGGVPYAGLGSAVTLNLDGVSKSYGATWIANGGNLGLMGHEMGHALGLPHSTGNTGQTNNNKWDIMGWVLQQHTIAYHKDRLGWLPGRRIDVGQGSSTTVWLDALSQASAGWQWMKVPIPASTRYYTVEARVRIGYDDNLSGSAVIIHEVDPGRGEPAHVIDIDNNGDTGDAGAMWVVGETFTDASAGITITVNAASPTAFNVTATVAPPSGPLPVITQDPPDQRQLQFASASFVLGVAGATFIQWQESSDGGLNWTTLTNVFPYSDVNTTTLNVHSTTAISGRRYRAVASNLAGSTTSGSGLLTVVAGGTNLLQNSTFTTNFAGWSGFATPSAAYLVANVVGGVMQFYRVPPPPGQSNQAVLLQSTNMPMAANTMIQASFLLGNSSNVRKRMSVLIHDGDFSDLTVCTFFLAPHAPLAGYSIVTHPTEAWQNATISFYAATEGSDGGAYLLDSVTLTGFPTAAVPDTICVSAGPVAQVLPDGAEWIQNGDFSGGTGNWSVFGSLTSQVADGVFEFFRPAGEPSGVVLQNTNHAVATQQRLTARFNLGNSSNVRKRVTVLLHEGDFSDLTACTFWLAPGQALAPYSIRTITTKAWTNATVSVYPATIGPEPWMRLDNVSLKLTPNAVVSGTYCLEPGTSK